MLRLQLFILSVLSLLLPLVACTGPPPAEREPRAGITLLTVEASQQAPANHVAGRQSTLLQASYSQPPDDPPSAGSILDVHPLDIGMRRTYSVTVSYQEETTVRTWQGRITETVTNAEAVPEGQLFTVVQEGDHPLWDASGTRTLYYLASGERLYRLQAEPQIERVLQEEVDALVLYRWPMAVGDLWGDPVAAEQDPPLWNWQVAAREDVETPAGRYEDCYRLSFRTNPDHLTNWFCPGIGTVRHVYVHHGSLLEERWELEQLTPAETS